jgi:hypothetical protein
MNLKPEMPDSDVIVVDPTLWEKMTETERAKYFRELSMTKKTFILNGVTYEYDSNPGPISWSYGGSSEKPKNHSE